MNRSEETGFDVRIMNAATVLLLVVFCASLALAIMRWVANRSAFSLQGITVLGDTNHSNVPTVRAHVVSRVQGSFFTVNLGQTREVFETMPWVRNAVVHRDFPNRLRVQLQEHRAAAFWGEESEPRLLNSFGEVFDANVAEVEQEGLPRLNGPQGQSRAVLATYRALDPQFSAMNLSIDALELTSHGSWRILLNGGAVIEAGRGDLEEVGNRTRNFLKTLTRVVARYDRPLSALETADLRHENGYAVRLHGVSTLLSPSPIK